MFNIRAERHKYLIDNRFLLDFPGITNSENREKGNKIELIENFNYLSILIFLEKYDG